MAKLQTRSVNQILIVILIYAPNVELSCRAQRGQLERFVCAGQICSGCHRVMILKGGELFNQSPDPA